MAPYDEGYPYPFTERPFAVTRALSPVLKGLGIQLATHSFNHPIPAAARFEQEFYPSIDTILPFLRPADLPQP
jgi:hypothetical protein